MMLQSDNDNFAFAINAIRWLREGPDGTTRTKVLFLVEGKIIDNFNMNLSLPPTMPMPPIKAVNRLLRGLENERFFHRILNELVPPAIRERLLQILLGVVTFVLLLYGAKKFMEGRYQLETAVPRMVGPQVALGPRAPQIEQRHHALFRQADLGREARMLSQAWLRQEFGIEIERPAEFHVQGFFWGRGRLCRQAEFVLTLAQSASPIPMTRREFARLLRTLPRLSGEIRAGRLALLVAGKNVRQTSATLAEPHG
jgi:hypothetical protein